jgi:hypothetical protein
MKIKIERKQEVEMEVQLPLFTKDKHHYYRIDVNETLILFAGYTECTITLNDYMMNFPLGFEQITEEEFNHVYILLISKLNSYAK